MQVLQRALHIEPSIFTAEVPTDPFESKVELISAVRETHVIIHGIEVFATLILILLSLLQLLRHLRVLSQAPLLAVLVPSPKSAHTIYVLVQLQRVTLLSLTLLVRHYLMIEIWLACMQLALIDGFKFEGSDLRAKVPSFIHGIREGARVERP